MCRQLNPGQRDCIECKSVSPPLDQTTETTTEETVNLCQCHQTGPVSGETINVCQSIINVYSVVANNEHIVQRQPQRKGISPAVLRQRH